MNDAPERIWLLDWKTDHYRAMWADWREYPVDDEAEPGDVEYIRADLVATESEEA